MAQTLGELIRDVRRVTAAVRDVYRPRGEWPSLAPDVLEIRDDEAHDDVSRTAERPDVPVLDPVPARWRGTEAVAAELEAVASTAWRLRALIDAVDADGMRPARLRDVLDDWRLQAERTERRAVDVLVQLEE